MGSVFVAHGADVILSKGYGAANLEWDVPNTPSTKFRLGSITKQFTAASILLLEERGKLKLDDPIKTYLPDAPAAWDRITVFNLLTHSSGIPNFTGLPKYKTLEPTDAPPAKTIALFGDKPLDFPPGEKMSYSNSGYILFGSSSRRSAAAAMRFVQDNIFTPLGMNDSRYGSNSAIIAHRAAGYSPSPPHGPVNAGCIHMSVPYAAGGLDSTTADLLRWEQGLFGGNLLSPASLQKMLTPFKNDYQAANPGGGVAVLYANRAVGAASTPTLTVTLPADGTWVDFGLAGLPGKPSVDDLDCLLVAASGAANLTVPLMVRIRISSS